MNPGELARGDALDVEKADHRGEEASLNLAADEGAKTLDDATNGHEWERDPVDDRRLDRLQPWRDSDADLAGARRITDRRHRDGERPASRMNARQHQPCPRVCVLLL